MANTYPMSSPTNHNILQTEQSFQQLKSQLRSFSSERIRLVMYERFFKGIQDGGPPQRFLSYFQELVDPFSELLKPENLSYSSPQYLRSLQQILRAMKTAGLAESSSQEFQSKISLLNKHLLTCYCYLGEFDKVQTLLGIKHSCYPNPHGSNMEHLRSIIRIDANAESSELLEGVLSGWESMIDGSSTETVWIPLVEKVDLQGESLTVPMIQPLSANVEQRSRQAGEHLIFFNNYPITNNSPIYYQAYDAVHVAAKQLHRSLSRNKPYFRVMFGFPQTEYFYTGESFGLGMTLVASAAFHEAVNQRNQYRIRRNLAVTGVVDLRGDIRAVSEVTIKAKLKAVYNSPFERFVAPLQNEDDLKIYVETLHETHANKNVLLQPGEKIEAILEHDAVSEKIRIPLSEWTQTHVKRSQVMRYTGGFVSLIVLLWIGWWLNRDMNPVLVNIEGRLLQAWNANHDLLWSHEFLFQPVPNSSEEVIRADRLIHVIDIDGDNLNEVIYGNYERSRQKSGWILAFDSDGSVLWEYDEQPSLECGSQSYDDFYVTRSILPVINSNADSSRIVVCFGHNLYWPYRVVVLNMDGEAESEYWHAGQIKGLYQMDGELENIVFWGTNNALNAGVLGKLNIFGLPRFSPGFLDKCDSTLLRTMNELCYLTFRVSQELSVQAGDFRPEITDFLPSGTDTYTATLIVSSDNGPLFYSFDREFNITNFTISDFYFSSFQQYHGMRLYEKYSPDEVMEQLTDIYSYQQQNGPSKTYKLFPADE